VQPLGLQATAHQRARQLLVACLEADVEFMGGVFDAARQLGLADEQLAVLTVEPVPCPLVFLQRHLHLAHRLAQQNHRFFEAIKHRVGVGTEQPRHACHQGHGILLDWVRLGSLKVSTRGGENLRHAEVKRRGPVFTGCLRCPA
jgi:hypothetical protein